MAAAALTKTTLSRGISNKVNLTDASYSTLTTGAGNGRKWTFLPTDVIVLLNDTAGTATFTVLMNDTAITADGGTVTDPTFTVAAGKTVVLRLGEIFKQSSDSMVYLECDVAGKAIVLDCS